MSETTFFSCEKEAALRCKIERKEKALYLYSSFVHSQAAIVTNTTLTILRLFGKYIQMMRLLQPIAFDVMVCLSHLFDYYLYSVFTFFGAR